MNATNLQIIQEFLDSIILSEHKVLRIFDIRQWACLFLLDPRIYAFLPERMTARVQYRISANAEIDWADELFNGVLVEENFLLKTGDLVLHLILISKSINMSSYNNMYKIVKYKLLFV